MSMNAIFLRLTASKINRSSCYGLHKTQNSTKKGSLGDWTQDTEMYPCNWSSLLISACLTVWVFLCLHVLFCEALKKSVCFKSAILNSVTFKEVLTEGQGVLLWRSRRHTLLSKGDNDARSRSPEHSSYLRFYCLLFASYDKIGATLRYSSPWQVIRQVCVVATCKVSAVFLFSSFWHTLLHPVFFLNIKNGCDQVVYES